MIVYVFKCKISISTDHRNEATTFGYALPKKIFNMPKITFPKKISSYKRHHTMQIFIQTSETNKKKPRNNKIDPPEAHSPTYSISASTSNILNGPINHAETSK